LLAGHWLRRRRRSRRAEEAHAVGRDWHDAHWLGAALVVLLLSISDAFLTLTLMRHGAEEANPLMAPLLSAGGPAFAYWKVGLTAFGVMVLTAFARFRLFGVIPVGGILYLLTGAYIVLVTYELQLLQHFGSDFVSYCLAVPLQLSA
jgi:hypothetical protein